MRQSMRVEQTIERGIQIVFGTVVQQFADQFRELLIPEFGLQPAARLCQSGRQPDQLIGIVRYAFA